MTRTETVEHDFDELKSPLPKLVRFFRKSRDRWKQKHRDRKAKCKHLSNQVRAVQKSRDFWSERARVAEQRIAELEEHLKQVKTLGSA